MRNNEGNVFREIGDRTNGVITPANFVSVAGLALTAFGCHEYGKGNKKAAVGIIAAGALCDALDGRVARATKTDVYRVGRWLDIVNDGVKAAMLTKTLHDAGDYSLTELVATYGPKLAGWTVNGASQFILGNEVYTSKTGKVAEVARWVSPAMAVASSILKEDDKNSAANKAKTVGHVATAVAATLGTMAAVGYAKTAIDTEAKKK